MLAVWVIRYAWWGTGRIAGGESRGHAGGLHHEGHRRGRCRHAPQDMAAGYAHAEWRLICKGKGGANLGSHRGGWWAAWLKGPIHKQPGQVAHDVMQGYQTASCSPLYCYANLILLLSVWWLAVGARLLALHQLRAVQDVQHHHCPGVPAPF